MRAVEIDTLWIRYPRSERPALAGLSCAVEAGECVLVLGPTGSGKSTLALTLTGLVPQSLTAEMRGYVRVLGLDTVETPVGDLAAQVATVFQDPDAQLCMMRVDEEVAFALENLGTPPEAIGSRVGAALHQVGLADRPWQRLDRLSGGQKQRVVLAAALAPAPRLLVLDEPTANLDPRATREFFSGLDHRDGATRIVIEHKLEDVIGSVDRVIALDAAGGLLDDGPRWR